MLQQRVLCCQSLTADGARVGPLSRVHPFMHLERVLLGKAFATLTALKRALP